MLSPIAAGPTIHHEAIDWATRAAANGGVISTGTVRAISDFCKAVTAAGIRGKLYRFNPFAGGNLSGALVPLFRGPAWQGATYGNTTDTNVNFVSGDYADSGSSGGLKGNGTNKYLNTGFAANTLAAANSHLGVGLVTANTLTGNREAIGAYNGAQNSFALHLISALYRVASFTRFATASDTFGPTVTASLSPGNIIAAWPTCYRDGSAVGVNATTSQNYPSAHSFFVFANSQSGTTAIDYTDARLGWYSIGETMTASQVAAYSSALATLRTALGR